jgi:lysophospholipase L1-like esterase
MKQTILLFALIASLHCVAQKTSFSGTWIINKSKINFGGAPEWVLPKEFIIDQQNDKIIIERAVLNEKMEEHGYTEKLPFDGSVSRITIYTGGKRNSSINKWNDDEQTLVLITQGTTGDNQPVSKIKENWSLSDDRNTLIIDWFAEDANGLKYTIKAFYDKKSYQEPRPVMLNKDQDWANRHRYAEANKALHPLASGENRIVFMGNSITELWKITDSSFFAGKHYINRGISGQTTPQMLVRFRDDVIDLSPKVVVILAGINDIAENTGRTTLENIFGNIVSMTQLARANNIRVVLSSVLPAYDFPWRPGLQPAEKVAKLNVMIKAYADKNNIVYVNYYSSMVDDRKGLQAALTQDGVHPTLAGYKVMEPLVEKAIADALRRK